MTCPADAYKDAEGIPIHNKKILVDVERGRTVKGWKPRKLGGGLGGRPKPVDPATQIITPAFGGGFRGGMRGGMGMGGGFRGGFRGGFVSNPDIARMTIELTDFQQRGGPVRLGHRVNVLRYHTDLAFLSLIEVDSVEVAVALG